MSSGVCSRPSGVVWRTKASNASLTGTTKDGAGGGDAVGRHGRPEETRADGVDTDVGGAELLGEGLRQPAANFERRSPA